MRVRKLQTAVHAPSIAPSNTVSNSTDRKTVDISVKGADSSGTVAASTRFTNLPGSAPRPSPDGAKGGTEVPRTPETHTGGVNIGAQTVPSGKAAETHQNNTRMTQRETRADSQSAHKDHRMSERDTRTAQQDTRSTQHNTRISLCTEADASRNPATPPVKATPQNKTDAPRPGTAGTGTSLDTRQTVRRSGSEERRETRQSVEANRSPVSSPMPLRTGNSVSIRSDASTLRTKSRTDSFTSRFTSVSGTHTTESVSAARGGTVSMSHPSESLLPRSDTAESGNFSDYRQTGRELNQVTKTESGTSSAGVMQPPVRVVSSPQSSSTAARASIPAQQEPLQTRWKEIIGV